MSIAEYKETRERWRTARSRGDDADAIEAELDAIWHRMSGADRRTVLGIEGREKEKTATA